MTVTRATVAVAALVAAAFLFLAGVRVGESRAPSRHEVVTAAAAQHQVHDLELHGFKYDRTQGPVQVREVTRVFRAPAPGCTAPTLARETTREETRAPVHTAAESTSARTSTSASSSSSSSRELTIAAPPPRWALYAGTTLLPDRALAVGAGLRVAGPVWLELHAVPRLELRPPPLELGLRVELF